MISTTEHNPLFGSPDNPSAVTAKYFPQEKLASPSLALTTHNSHLSFLRNSRMLHFQPRLVETRYRLQEAEFPCARRHSLSEREATGCSYPQWRRILSSARSSTYTCSNCSDMSTAFRHSREFATGAPSKFVDGREKQVAVEKRLGA